MLLYPSCFRKKQQGSVGSLIIWVSAALSNPLPSEHFPYHDGLLGRRALQETLLSRPAQPAGYNICQDIFQDDRGLKRVTRDTWRKIGQQVGYKMVREQILDSRMDCKYEDKPTSTTGYIYFKNTKVWKDRASEAEAKQKKHEEYFISCANRKESGQTNDWKQPEKGV